MSQSQPHSTSPSPLLTDPAPDAPPSPYSSPSDAEESKASEPARPSSSLLPSIFASSSTSSSNTSQSANIPSPSISSSPTSNEIPSQSLPEPSSSFLGSLFASIIPWQRSIADSSSVPVSGVTETGLRWHRLSGETGFAIESPSAPPASAAEIAAVRQLCTEMTETRPPPSARLSVLNDSDENKDSDREVGVIDLDSVEWWTLLDPSKESLCDLEEPIDEGYVVINEDDVTEAISSFLASVLASHPHALSLSPKELQSLVEKSLQPVKPSRILPAQSHRLICYGYYAYLAYSWSSTAVALYRRPWLIKLAATGAMKVGSWIVVLFI